MVASLAFGGFANGQIPASALTSIGAGFLLESFCAQQFTGAREEILRDYGFDILDFVNETYRDLDGQHYWRTWWCNQGKCGNAAIVGTSVHGWAKAIDFNVDAMTQLQYAITVAVLLKYGFVRDVPGESWHFSFREHLIQWFADEMDKETPEQKEERELVSIKSEIFERLDKLQDAILFASGRGATVVYWCKEWSRTYSISPGLIVNHRNEVELNLAYRDAGQTEERSIQITAFELVRLFKIAGLGEFVPNDTSAIIGRAPLGQEFYPGLKVTW